jgi:hypothetical protein
MRSALRVLLLVLCALAGGQASAQKGSSAPDPNQTPLNFPFTQYNTVNQNNINSVSLVANQGPDAGQEELAAIVAGQSNCSDIIATSGTPQPYTPTNASSINQLNINDGGIYTILDPVLGTSLNIGGGFSVLPVFDQLITAGKFARVVVEPVCIDGSAVADWQNGIIAGRLATAINRLTAKGWVASSKVVVIIIWMQGEEDNLLATTQIAYTASLNSLIAQSRTAGFPGPWFVAEETYYQGATSSAVQNAQTVTSPSGVINNGSGVYAGPNVDSLVGSICSGSAACRQSDNIHLTGAGRTSLAPLWTTALHASGISPF